MLISSVTPRRVLPFLALGLVLAGCQSGGGSGGVSITVDDPGFKALVAGDYAKSQSVFEPMFAKSPRDPYIELDLGLAYQGQGRMDLAEPLYRNALVDGANIVPFFTTNPGDKGKTISDIACENLKLGLKREDACSPAAPPPPPPPPPVKTFIVFFDFNKSNLTAEGHSVVSEAVKTAKTNGFVKVMVTGHTDTVGSDRYNQKLSVRRAESVKSEMIGEGMDGSQISIEGKSFHDPLVPTGKGVREPQNRRAVIDLGG
jgi:outer membrane protein OmpA-like peptidoglycan-associated protein